jgi:hypothetical protein
MEEISDDFEMSEDPIRAKKLVCLVCTGILENDLQRLDNFSFVELLQDLYQQYPTIEALKEDLVKAVKTIAPQKQRLYLIVAKLVFNIVSKLYKQLAMPAIAEPVISSAISSQIEPKVAPIPHPILYSVEKLVINAGSAQLIAQEVVPPAEIEPAQQPERESDIYDWVANEINADSQQVRLKKLLFYTCQDIWESDIEQLNSINWAGLLRELVSFMPTLHQLMALLQESVQRVSKPAEYLPIGNLLLSKLQHLYPDGLDAIAPPSNQQLLDHKLLNNQGNKSSSRSAIPEKSKTPFDPKIASDLFDVRMELMRFTNSMRAKILLFSVLYYPFNPDRDNWQDLRNHGLDELLRQLFYVYPSFAEADNAIWQMSRSLNEPSAYEQSANYILQAIKTLYDQLESRSMAHPTEQSSPSFDNLDFTQANAFPNTSDDDETCQFM